MAGLEGAGVLQKVIKRPSMSLQSALQSPQFEARLPNGGRILAKSITICHFSGEKQERLHHGLCTILATWKPD